MIFKPHKPFETMDNPVHNTRQIRLRRQLKRAQALSQGTVKQVDLELQGLAEDGRPGSLGVEGVVFCLILLEKF